MGIARPTGAIATTTKSIVVRRMAASLQLEEAAEAQRRAFGRARIRCRWAVEASVWGAAAQKNWA
jgi:hypothetical protein